MCVSLSGVEGSRACAKVGKAELVVSLMLSSINAKLEETSGRGTVSELWGSEENK